MHKQDFQYIFGPVQSGRLGRSLGVDLLGGSICSFDCIYCEVGRTQIKTLERKPYVLAEDILKELQKWQTLDFPTPDHITLGGQGEPCLNSEMGTVLEGISRLAPSIPRAVLTNATLLGDEQVRRDLQLSHVVLPSMDTLVQEEYKLLNRPVPDLDIHTIARDMLEWSRTYQGQIFLEVLLIKGMNDTQKNLDRLIPFCSELKPDRIDVVTLTRPGTSERARPVDQDTLRRWRTALHAVLAEPENIESLSEKHIQEIDDRTLEQVVLNSLKRRPQSLSQLSWALGIEHTSIAPALERLLADKKITKRDIEYQTFYSAQCF